MDDLTSGSSQFHKCDYCGNYHTFSEKYCEDCDGEIPEARRKAQKGCTRCVACQSSHDTIIKASYNRRGSKDSQLR